MQPNRSRLIAELTRREAVGVQDAIEGLPDNVVAEVVDAILAHRGKFEETFLAGVVSEAARAATARANAGGLGPEESVRQLSKAIEDAVRRACRPRVRVSPARVRPARAPRRRKP